MFEVNNKDTRTIILYKKPWNVLLHFHLYTGYGKQIHSYHNSKIKTWKIENKDLSYVKNLFKVSNKETTKMPLRAKKINKF